MFRFLVAAALKVLRLGLQQSYILVASVRLANFSSLLMVATLVRTVEEVAGCFHFQLAHTRYFSPSMGGTVFDVCPVPQKKHSKDAMMFCFHVAVDACNSWYFSLMSKVALSDVY
jgi:hypothetical protein